MPISQRNLAKEYLTVLQESLPKEALAEILSGLSIGEDVSGLLEKALLDTATPLEDEAVSAIEPYNPKEHDVEELIESLRNNVVRLVFYKVNGDRRIMYATRNPEIIKLYDADSKDPRKNKNNAISDLASEEKIAQQIASDAIRIFDLEKNEFRAFKPSRLAAFDKEDNVGSWIEFKPEYDTWYIMAKEEGDIHTYYRGGKEAINRGKSKARKIYEIQARKDLQDAEYTREQNAKREEELMNDPKYAEQMRMDKLKKYYTAIKNKMIHLTKSDTTHSSSVAFPAAFHTTSELIDDFLGSIMANYNIQNKKMVSVEEEIDLNVLELEGELFIFNPYFIMNTTNRYVYYDAYKVLPHKTTQTVKTTKPLVHNKIVQLVETIEPLGKAAKRLIKLNYTDKDVRRAKRLAELVGQLQTQLARARVVAKVNNFEVQFMMENGDSVLYVNPVVITVKHAYYGDYKHKELSRRDAPTSVLPMVEEARQNLQLLTSKPETHVETLIPILEIVEHAYNLRKKRYGEVNITE